MLGRKQKNSIHVDRKTTLLHPGLIFSQILLPDCYLLNCEQTSVPVAACADLPAAPQTNCHLACRQSCTVQQESACFSQIGHTGCTVTIGANARQQGYTHLQSIIAMLQLH